MNEWLLLLLAAVMVAGCALFVAAEFSFITVDRTSVEQEVDEGRRGAEGLRSALRTLSTQLSGAQLGITITNLAIGFLAEPSLASLLTGPLERAGIRGAGVSATALVLAMLISTTVTMVAGELIPKNLAIALPMRTARTVQGFMRGFTTLTKPVIVVLNGSANRFLRRVGVEPTEELASARSPQELSFLVAHSAREGTLPQATATLLRRSLNFGERRARDVMTPRSQVDFVNPTDSLAVVVERIHHSGHSRFPVLDSTNERVLGVIATRQIVGVEAQQRPGRAIQEVMQPPVLVPATIDLDSLLTMLRDGSTQLAVVIDEYGGVDGVVTLEDLIEELTGELDDEHDVPTPPREVRPGTWELSALLRIDETAAITGVMLSEDPQYETLAGLVLYHLNRLAKVGDQVHLVGHDDVRREHRVDIEVLRLDELRIDLVRVTVSIDPSQSAASEASR